MKYFQFISKRIMVIGIVFALFALALIVKTEPIFTTEHPSGPGLALRPPAFIKAANAAEFEELQQTDWTFLLEEAGVTAYTKVDQQLDLEFLLARFKHIRARTNQYIQGIVHAPGYAGLPEFDEKGEVQIIVHRDGWIVAYLTRWQTAAELFDWVNYDQERLTGTLVENTVKYLARELKLPEVNISYYDFRYPDATDLILVADRADGITTRDSFIIHIPKEIQIFERTWSAAQFDIRRSGYQGSTQNPGSCDLNDAQLTPLHPPIGKWRLYLGPLTEDNFPQGKDHRISVFGNGMRGYCGVAVVYREAAQ
jgi:hypothetical protein